MHIKRSDPEDKNKDFISRKQVIDGGVKLTTLDEKTRSIEVIAATEAKVKVFDPQRYEVVDEILLMSGVEIPKDNNIPLTIEHMRSVEAVIGSFRDMRVENGQLVGRAFFSSDSESEKYYVRTKEGHLNKFSIMYPVGTERESVYIEKGRSETIQGRTYQGPVLVTTKWQPRFLGLVIFPADQNAKSRSETNNEKMKEKNKMDERLRKFLERSGLNKDASEADAWKYFETMGERKDTQMLIIQPGKETAKPEPKIDIEAERKAAVEAERTRTAAITTMCERAEYPQDLRKELFNGDVTIEAARAKVLDWVIENKTTTQPEFSINPRIQVGKDEKEKFRAAAEDSLVMRSSIGVTVDKPAPGAQDLMGYSLAEMARHSVMLAGGTVGGNRLEMIGRAMTTSDFPKILANVANKSLAAGWDTTPATWREWCATGSVANFLTHTAVNPSEFSDLEEIPEGTEYKYGKRTEAQEQYSIVTYGKLAAITRQAIINDDLNAITSNFMGMGEAAARKVNDLPYALLVANALMGDGVALFDVSTHANYVTSGAAPGTTTIAAMILAMGIQKDLQGLRSLNISPEYVIMPKALEGAAEIFFQSTAFSDHSTVATDSTFASTRVNPYAGTRFKRIYEGYFDANSLPAGWFGAARKGKTVTIFFLNGAQAPYMETQNGWNVDGVEYKVRIDAGAKAVDWRGLYWNDGA